MFKKKKVNLIKKKNKNETPINLIQKELKIIVSD